MSIDWGGAERGGTRSLYGKVSFAQCSERGRPWGRFTGSTDVCPKHTHTETCRHTPLQAGGLWWRGEYLHHHHSAGKQTHRNRSEVFRHQLLSESLVNVCLHELSFKILLIKLHIFRHEYSFIWSNANVFRLFFLGGCEFTWYSDGALVSELDETDMN